MVALENDGHPRGLKSLTNMLLVECKNWSAAVRNPPRSSPSSVNLNVKAFEYGFLFAGEMDHRR